MPMPRTSSCALKDILSCSGPSVQAGGGGPDTLGPLDAVRVSIATFEVSSFADDGGSGGFPDQPADGPDVLPLFPLQHSQNRDSRALHAKLDELIAAIPDARDELERLEERTEEEIGLIPRGRKVTDRTPGSGLPNG